MTANPSSSSIPDLESSSSVTAFPVQQGPHLRRRKRALKGVDRAIPPRPKLPLSAYNLFVQDFMAKSQGKKGGPRTMAALAKKWAALPPKSRAQLGARCKAGQKRYQAEITLWRKYKRASKRPASPYALFVQDYWKKEKANLADMPFEEVSRLIAKEWGKMRLVQKFPYAEVHERLKIRHRVEQSNVASGKGLNLSWKEEVIAAGAYAGGGGGATPNQTQQDLVPLTEEELDILRKKYQELVGAKKGKVNQSQEKGEGNEKTGSDPDDDEDGDGDEGDGASKPKRAKMSEESNEQNGCSYIS